MQWQKDQVAQLCELYEKGYKLVDIADMLGIPLERVKKKVFTMGTAGQLTLRSHRQKSKPQKVPPEQNRQKEQRETQLVTHRVRRSAAATCTCCCRITFSRNWRTVNG